MLEEKNREELEPSAYQSSLVYVMLVLLGLFFAGAVIIARLCYLPYSKGLSIPGELHKTVWSFMVVPSVFCFLGLWLSNMINKRLKAASVLSALVSCLFIAMIPFLYSLGEYNTVSYFTSAFAFFLIAASASVILLDLRPPRRARYKAFGVAAALLPVLVELVFIYVLYNYTVVTNFFPRIAVSMLCPLICGVAFLCCLVSAFSAVFARETLVLHFIAAGYSCFITAFEEMNHRPLHLILAVLTVLCFVLGCWDIFKFIKFKEKKNDN